MLIGRKEENIGRKIQSVDELCQLEADDGHFLRA